MIRVLLALTLVAAACATTEQTGILPPDQQYEHALALYEEGEYAEAVEALQGFVFNYPQDPRVVDARWRIAEAYYADEDWATAAQAYLDFQSQYPDRARAPEAIFQAGKAYQHMSLRPELDQSDTRRALNVFQRVVTEYPGSDFAEPARERIERLRSKLAEKTYLNAEFYYDEEDWEAVEIYATDLIADFPESDWLPAAYALLVRARCEMGEEQEAAAAYRRLVELFPESSAARDVDEGLRPDCRPAETAPQRANGA
ncbi:MAG: outer membrane protein assembly factor BamD [Gemmatimonadota bacterium]|nr:outer membrane protein assembly factor BamD [Gemmatimonadota bacterium]